MKDIVPTRLDKKVGDIADAFKKLLDKRTTAEAQVSEKVATIIADIRAGGDEALLAYGKEFDHIPDVVKTIDELIIIPSKKHWDGLSSESQAALETAKQRIEHFHQEIFAHYDLQKNFYMTDDVGATLGNRWSPIAQVGIYVPGGVAAYPSSVLMNAMPARAAGVRNITMACPLGLGGGLASPLDKKFSPEDFANPLVLGAAYLAGVSSILCLGGAGAIAAMAYGTATVKAVDKIVGPGNDYVAEAKRQVFGKVGIDMIAGPSEVLVLADKNFAVEKNIETKAEWIALDLISQAEHDKRAMAVLITDDAPLAEAVVKKVAEFLSAPTNDAEHLHKQKIAAASWQDYGVVVVVDDVMTDGAALANIMAAEHVELMVEDSEKLSNAIVHAGAIFFGAYSPEAFGDYLAGPSHVLPTFGSARFSSGLSIFDFLKRTSLIKGNQQSMAQWGDKIIHLAAAEKLPHHGLSIAKRLEKINGKK